MSSPIVPETEMNGMSSPLFLVECQRDQPTEPGHRVIADDNVPRALLQGQPHGGKIVHNLVCKVVPELDDFANDQFGVNFGILDDECSQRSGHNSFVTSVMIICSRTNKAILAEFTQPVKHVNAVTAVRN